MSRGPNIKWVGTCSLLSHNNKCVFHDVQCEVHNHFCFQRAVLLYCQCSFLIYGLTGFCFFKRYRLHVIDLDPSSVTSGGWLEDISLVEKYSISEEAYEKLGGKISMKTIFCYSRSEYLCVKIPISCSFSIHTVVEMWNVKVHVAKVLVVKCWQWKLHDWSCWWGNDFLNWHGILC